MPVVCTVSLHKLNINLNKLRYSCFWCVGKYREGRGAASTARCCRLTLSRHVPWLYLKGISTGDLQELLAALLGEQAKGLSANKISRLKGKWLEEHSNWRCRDLSDKRYVYFWADGVHTNVRMDDRLCLLVIVGETEHGRKELVAVEDGFRESTASWEE